MDNVASDAVDGNVASKAKDVGDNSRMTCGAEVSGGSVKYTGSMKVWEDGVEYSWGIKVLSVEPPDQPPPRSPGRPRPRPPPLPFPRPRIGCMLIVVNDT